jgi:hypothetical protein
VIFISDGRLVFDGSPSELTREEHNLDQRFYQLSGVDV